MTRNEIIEKLKDILSFADDKNPEAIEHVTEEARLAEDLGFSSISVLYMVIAIEEAFRVRFDNVSMGDFKTLGSVVDYIEERIR